MLTPRGENGFAFTAVEAVAEGLPGSCEAHPCAVARPRDEDRAKLPAEQHGGPTEPSEKGVEAIRELRELLRGHPALRKRPAADELLDIEDGSGEQGLDKHVLATSKLSPTHAVLFLGVSDHRFHDCLSPS